MIIAAADTIIDRPSRELAEEIFPGLEFRADVGGNDTLLSIEKARRLLNYQPQHSWKDMVGID
jgi:UDP-glucose 4-epimerase